MFKEMWRGLFDREKWRPYAPEGANWLGRDLRRHVRNLVNFPFVGGAELLTSVEQNMGNRFDEYTLTVGEHKLPMRVFGNGNKEVSNPRIEVCCRDSESEGVWEVAGRLPL